MYRFLLIVVVLAIAFAARGMAAPEPSAVPSTARPSPQVDFAQLPWLNGESLTYLVSWEGFEAAGGIFVATKTSDHWEFKLALASRGVVNSIYPFSGTFWSIIAGSSPWRSTEYGEYRFEPKRVIRERTRIDYSAGFGLREQWSQGKTRKFKIDQMGVDDIGTMLYHLRTGAWKPGDRRTIYVYESSSEKQAEAECTGRETRAFGAWPKQALLRISVLPTVGTHHRGHLVIWMTDDTRRLPLHAELEFKYGTFDIDLTQVAKTRPASS